MKEASYVCAVCNRTYITCNYEKSPEDAKRDVHRRHSKSGCTWQLSYTRTIDMDTSDALTAETQLQERIKELEAAAKIDEENVKDLVALNRKANQRISELKEAQAELAKIIPAREGAWNKSEKRIAELEAIATDMYLGWCKGDDIIGPMQRAKVALGFEDESN